MKFHQTNFFTSLILQAFILWSPASLAFWQVLSVPCSLCGICCSYENVLQIEAKTLFFRGAFPTWPDRVLSLHALQQSQLFFGEKRPHICAHHCAPQGLSQSPAYCKRSINICRMDEYDIPYEPSIFINDDLNWIQVNVPKYNHTTSLLQVIKLSP